ncbi:hypothetical protein BCIN_03g09160 [Botrytis cinerea B05.10]|uniref:Uncharacterized protein n=1 Tax=Botryotinia fuckeliana (strain B05.10) TaxID=332648 RepID=A0A384JDR2_BOTFB|nr:hypothetical protein BCIN_03g09160 [Botrytis cinerea B05.10]ATZ48739.1 hypothetical protein BCIN_03g09160 [Botrytis cinerea B05.10]
MRHLHTFLPILILCLCSFLSMADGSGWGVSVNILTLTSYTTVSPTPIVVTSSEFVTPAGDIPVTLTSELIVIYTSYPTNGSPFRETGTILIYPTYPASAAATVATLSTSTLSEPIPQTTDSSGNIETDSSSIIETSSSSTIDKSTVPTTSSTLSATATTKPSIIPTFSQTSTSAMATGTTVLTPPNNNARKSIPIVAIIVPVIIGAILAIAALVLILWWLRRRNLKKKGHNASNSTVLRQGNVYDRYNQCRNTGNRVSCQARNPQNDRLSVLDKLGLTDKKLWPSWPFGDKMTLGTHSIKQAIMGTTVPVSSTPPRPARSYEHELQFVTSPRPVELPGNSRLSENETSTVHQSQTETSIAPPIPAKSPDRDLKLHGRNATGNASSGSEPSNIRKSIDKSTLPRLSNYDGHLSNQSSGLHGAVASPSTPTTAWPHGSNPHVLAPALPQVQNDSVTTPEEAWVEPPSRFSTPSNSSTSPNATSNGSANTSPKQWVEPTSDAATGNRSRAYNAIPHSPVEADALRTVAERDNTLALLEGRQKAHATASISGIFNGNEHLRLYNEAVKRARRRSVDRRGELETRFPFARAPVPGTVTDATHDVSYTQTEAGTSIQRVDKDSDFGGWM